jgi:hypothetical protein
MFSVVPFNACKTRNLVEVSCVATIKAYLCEHSSVQAVLLWMSCGPSPCTWEQCRMDSGACIRGCSRTMWFAVCGRNELDPGNKLSTEIHDV